MYFFPTVTPVEPSTGVSSPLPAWALLSSDLYVNHVVNGQYSSAAHPNLANFFDVDNLDDLDVSSGNWWGQSIPIELRKRPA